MDALRKWSIDMLALYSSLKWSRNVDIDGINKAMMGWPAKMQHASQAKKKLLFFLIKDGFIFTPYSFIKF